MSPQMSKEGTSHCELPHTQVVDVPDVPPSPAFLAAMTAERKTLEGFQLPVWELFPRKTRISRHPLFSQMVETSVVSWKSNSCNSRGDVIGNISTLWMLEAWFFGFSMRGFAEESWKQAKKTFRFVNVCNQAKWKICYVDWCWSHPLKWSFKGFRILMSNDVFPRVNELRYKTVRLR